MKTKRIVVLGASGFVGTLLTERLTSAPGAQVVPVIHSAASAWRLARRTTPLVQLDLADRAGLQDVMKGATHVVNCTRGPRPVMIDGLRNILEACRSSGVGRLVHLSSVLVYGDPPAAASVREDAPAAPLPGSESYGYIKFEQDEMVKDAARAGLATVVLCPPNITGPFSGYVLGIANGLRSGSFRLLEDGSGPCNLVDVRNLCHAIELALDVEGEATDGSRLFITDGADVTWRHVVDELLAFSGATNVPSIGRAELERLVAAASAAPRSTLRGSLRHLISGDVRAALRKDPTLAKVEKLARGAVARLGHHLESRLRLGIEGPAPVSRPDPYAGLAVGLCAQQLRNVRHQILRAREVLDYEPPVSFAQSMADFRAWYRAFHGQDSSYWPIASYLYTG